MKKIFSYILYILSLIPLAIYLYISISPKHQFTELGRLILIGISSILMYFGGLLLSKYYGNNKPMKRNLWIYFGLYLILVITLTLFDTSWGRTGIKIRSINNISKYINLKPFKTIKGYVLVFDSLYPTKEILLNLFGNFVAFMPMSIFLPLIFKKQNKWYIFLITMILMITTIEGLQLVTGSGRCDIDDLILNVGGAFILFIMLKIPPLKKLIRNVFLLEGNKVSKLFAIFVVLVITSLIGGFVWLINYRNKLLAKNINDLYTKYSFNVEIQDITKYCVDEEEKFYEDDIYDYYFECKKSDNIYVIVNRKERFTLKEVLVDDFKYDINLELLERLGLKYTKKNKYQYINVVTKSSKTEDETYSKPFVTFEKDDDILSVIKSDPVISSNEYKFKLHLIPKKEGETILKIVTKDKDLKEIIEEKEYKITIDEDLVLKYEKYEELVTN